jgi:gamma-glutamylaminecyclotransferase
MLVFVYGTLKRSHSNHGYMEGQHFVSMAMTQPRYRLHDLGGYPGMVVDESNGITIHGEIWEIDAACLARLDELEDIDGGEYAREIIPLLPPFDQARIEGYRYLRDVSEAPDIGGSW